MKKEVKAEGSTESGTELGADSAAASVDAVGGEADSVMGATSMTPTQCRALENLMSGQTVGDAAKGAGVGRRTLQRWLHENAAFAAAYNAWKKDTAEAARGSILALSEPAVRAIAGALEKGDAKTALAVVKGLGLLSPAKVGACDAEGVKKEREIEKKREEQRLFSEDMEAGFPV
jgi:hypothetical protein